MAFKWMVGVPQELKMTAGWAVEIARDDAPVDYFLNIYAPTKQECLNLAALFLGAVKEHNTHV